jgi:hypothetical protein
MIHKLTIPSLSSKDLHIVSVDTFEYDIYLGDICFAYDGGDVIGWLHVSALLPESNSVELRVLRVGYDGE